jgi:hypothetical protein
MRRAAAAIVDLELESVFTPNKARLDRAKGLPEVLKRKPASGWIAVNARSSLGGRSTDLARTTHPRMLTRRASRAILRHASRRIAP